ncbi:g13003 [Coccomyxa viridis]|uniref:Ubiquitin carboxyl-terminal hydrolase n=1 Tax=Coccomyxa viridis TaxID=1274662 RepID=A0ABP1GBQ3_9CHLO
MVHVSVKWGKQSHDVDVDTTMPGLVFKNQLYSLTGVPPDRQKIMVKGGMLQDDADLSKLNLKPKQKLMMMGTADKLPDAPTNAPVFMEDLPEEEQDVTGYAKYGAGLRNLGNTCYMNSTLQCLYKVPELRQSLAAYQAVAGPPDPAHKLTLATKELFGDLERSSQPVTPFGFLMQLREKYPQFAQQRNGLYMQQDAEECWTQLLYSLRERLKEAGGEGSDSVIQQLFGLGLHTRLLCAESEETIEEDSTVYELKCNITVDVNHLTEGIRLGLQDDREKNSEKLGRLALFAGSSAISRLPRYLTAQMVRFFYKVDTQQKAKILRKVVFPLVLDLYEFCTDEYKKALEGPRKAWQEAEDKRAGLEKAAKAKAKSAAKDDKAQANGAAKAEEAKPEGHANGSKADVEMKDAAEPSESTSADSEPYKGQLTGRYELTAVLTHKGRSADSGHYVSWAKQDDGQWLQFDDEEMIPRKEEEVIALSGGGDWHMAYLLLYRAVKA